MYFKWKINLLDIKINTKRDSFISWQMSENKMASSIFESVCIHNCTRGEMYSNVDLNIAIVSQIFHW